MQTKKKIFALVSRVYISSIIQSMEKVASFLVEAGHTVVYESETASNISLPGITSVNLEEIGAQAEAAIVIGGDGTMLGIARQLAPYSVPLIGINHGHLGFMADIPLNRMLLVLDKMLKGKYVSEQRFLIEGSIIRSGETIHHSIAFNDIVISAWRRIGDDRFAGACGWPLHVSATFRWADYFNTYGIDRLFPVCGRSHAASESGWDRSCFDCASYLVQQTDCNSRYQ